MNGAGDGLVNGVERESERVGTSSQVVVCDQTHVDGAMAISQ